VENNKLIYNYATTKKEAFYNGRSYKKKRFFRL
jgi:hypothetical protein